MSDTMPTRPDEVHRDPVNNIVVRLVRGGVPTVEAWRWSGWASATSGDAAHTLADWALAERARAERAEALLRALVADVTEKCHGPRGSSERRLSRNNEKDCGKPARYGLLTAWTCGVHRRAEDVNEIGSPALRDAMAALAAIDGTSST